VNRTVNLTKRVQTSRGLSYCSIVLAANGRVRADLVIVNGQQGRYPEGGIARRLHMQGYDGCTGGRKPEVQLSSRRRGSPPHVQDAIRLRARSLPRGGGLRSCFRAKGLTSGVSFLS
jgi:hypothetical protein